MTTPRQRKAEQAVLDHIRECRGLVAYWWFAENRMRAAAWRRLLLSGRVRREILGYPNWRVTIEPGNQRETKGQEL